MTKKLSFSLAALALAFGASAAPITPDQALQRVSGSTPGINRAPSSLTLAKTVKMENGVASAYIFVPRQGTGFTILSADDLAVPVLGYSDSGSVDVNNLPPSLEWWLNELGRKIEYVAKKGGKTDNSIYAPADMTEIAPMLTTRWNQDAPYNDNAPEINGVKAPTGCVATSFAQVMNYFKYPEKGRGTLRYTDKGTTRTLQLTKKKFDWDNMLNDYATTSYNEEQADAVAYLMQACGYGVEMSYGASASGAQSYKIVNAAIDNFKYDVATRYVERNYYSPVVWTQMIYDNLKDCGPVIYDGSSLTGGHSFVCDGYDGNGYFHFNWGWGGSSDGYYLLDALNPETQGIGGAEGGFNYSQGIVLGMQKPVEGSVRDTSDKMKIYGSVTGAYTNGYLTFNTTDADPGGWGNGCWHTINVVVGAVIDNAETGANVANVQGSMCSPGEFEGMERVSIDVYRYYPSTSLNPVVNLPSDLADGRYKVTVACRAYADEEAEWIPMICEWGNSNYCYIVVNDGNVVVENVSIKQLSVENAEITSPLYIGKNFKLSSTITNNTDIPLSLCYYPALYRNGRIQYKGDYMLVSANPGESFVKNVPVYLYTADDATDTGMGTYTLQIYDRESGDLIGTYGDYEMEYVSGSLEVTLDDLSIEGAEKQNHKVGNRTFKDVYVAHTNDVVVNFVYTVKRGYLDKSVSLVVNEYNPADGSWNLWDNNLYFDLPFAGVGETRDIDVEHDFTNNNRSTVYRIRAYYDDNKGKNSLGYILLGFDTTGVDGVMPDAEEGEVEYFNLQGVRIMNPEKGQLVIRKAEGKVDRVIIK